MTSPRTLLSPCLLALTLTLASAQETRLMRYPDISKTQVAFAYGGDLWTASRNGGAATRLTSHPGDELFPKFSPDGRYIAFTGEYDGNSDVYVIPAAGGEPRRLTYHPDNDMVLGWTPDSKKILFRSARFNPYQSAVVQLFLVPVEGGPAEMLPLKRGSLASFSADGTKIAYTPTSTEFRTWKRYRGGWTTYIGIFDLVKSAYEEIPRANSSDVFPMWHGDSIYFASDRDGVMNLHRYDTGSKKFSKLTSYTEYDVKWPSLGPDAIVFENGGRLFTFDLAKKQIKPIPVTVASDLVLTRPEIKNLASQIRGATLSPSGSRALLSARGEIFTVPVEKGSARNLTQSSGVHELDAAWSPNGKWIAYFSDRSGEYEIYLRPQMGGDEVRVTSDGECYRFNLSWSPNSRKLLYSDKKLRLWYVDIDEKKPVLVDTSDQAFSFVGRMDWSPDSRWIAFNKQPHGKNDVIHLYSLEQKKIFPVTDEFYDSTTPQFDRNGKYLYFLSSRFFFPSASQMERRFGYFNTQGIFAVTLRADEASPFGPESDEEKTPEEKKSDEKKPDEKKTEDKKADEKPTVIDIDGIGQRIVQVPVPPSNYVDLDARKEKIFYMTLPFEAYQQGKPGPPRPQGTLHVYDVKKREDKVVLDGINGYTLDKDGGKLLYRAMENIGVIDAAPGKKVGDGKLNTAGLQAAIDPRAEWKQILQEAWRIERDFYWEPAMGGLDWQKIGKRYEALLPWVSHRSDLNYLIGEMIAELNTSHAYVSGGEMPQRRSVGAGLLGVDFAADGGFFKIAKIYPGENWNEKTRSPLTEPGLKVKEGDYVIAVNGNPVRSQNDPYSYFQNLAGSAITLKINSRPSTDGAWEITVKPVTSESGLRYRAWVEDNRRKVSEATGGRVAYMHVPNTAIEGLVAFDKYLQGQLEKKALIVDERFNGGGWIPDFFTEKLQRNLLNIISPRDGSDQPYPGQAILGPKVMIVNELAGSGGDCFPWYFKRAKLGPVVGTRTWGGLIGVSRAIPMLDGGTVTAPEFAFWSTDNGGEWVVENQGVDPTHPVEQRPDLEVKGHDPQLEKAIELINDALKKEKPLPPRPKFPRKAL